MLLNRNYFPSWGEGDHAMNGIDSGEQSQKPSPLDIVGEKRAEETVRESEARYRTLFENMSNCVAIYRSVYDGEDFVIVDFNRAAEKSENIERNHIVGKSVLEVFPGVREFGLFEVFQRVWKTGLAEHHPVSWYKDERIEGWRENFVYKLPSGEIVALYSDETERKRWEQELSRLNDELEERVKQRTRELEAANKDLEAFASTVSHDLRAPLRAIAGFSQIIARRHRASLNEEGQRYVDNIVKAAGQMDQLINDLLNYSRLGRKAVNRQLVPMKEVVSQVIDQLSDRVVQTAAELIIPHEMPIIYVDRTLLTRMLTNLFENALNYRREDVFPRIELSVNTAPDSVVLIVTDNGLGIAPEYHEKVFNIFQRLHSQERYPGTGIGLAVVKRSAEMLGGSAWVESAVGQGSSFFVRLPVKMSLEESAPVLKGDMNE